MRLLSADYRKLENMILSVAALVVAAFSFVYLAERYLDKRQDEIDKLNNQLDEKVVLIERLRGQLIDKDDEIAEMRYDYAKELTKKLAKR